MATAIERLSMGRRVVVFDPRGVGASDRVPLDAERIVEHWVDDAVAVLDAVGATSVDVLANSHGAMVALVLAARHRHRVRSLTVVNGYARPTATDDYPYGFTVESYADLLPDMQSTDAGGFDVLTLVSPSVAGDPAYRRWWDAAGRRAASPAAAAELMSAISRLDVRSVLPDVRVPTLVVVRRGCPEYDAGHGRHLAAELASATLVEMPGVDTPWWIGDTDVVLSRFADHIAGVTRRPPPAVPSPS